MGSLANLFKEAERIALAEGQVEPGAEHMVMAALWTGVQKGPR